MKTRVGFAWLVSIPVALTLSSLLLASAIGLTSSAFGQTNANPDILRTGGLHNLTPVANLLRIALWSFGLVLLVIAGALTVLRRRVNPSLYKTAVDPQWPEDAREEAAVGVEESEVIEACADFGNPTQADDAVKASVLEVAPDKHARLYTPASGPVWNEPMLNAFLSACLKANCLGRAWQEAARRQQGQHASRRLPDPREAELIRKLKARWQEFHLDPEDGIFLEPVAGSPGSSRVYLIRVSREKHAVTWAALNAGFVIESVGRYLKSSDQVYPSGPGCYHVLNLQELTALSDEEKKRILRLKNISDPWQAMIAGPRFVRTRLTKPSSSESPTASESTAASGGLFRRWVRPRRSWQQNANGHTHPCDIQTIRCIIIVRHDETAAKLLVQQNTFQ